MAWKQKISFLVIFITALVLLCACRAHAAEPGYGEVTFKFYVDNSLRGKEMTMKFMEIDTLEFVEVTTSEFKDSDLTTDMPVGTYELDAIYYDGDWNFNYISSITCGTFTVTEDGITGDNVEDGVIYVITDLRVTTNVSIQANLIVSGYTGGTIQLCTHGETDAYYATDKQDVLQQEEYTFVIDGAEKDTAIDAGTHIITEVNAYSSSLEPLNVYYPEALELNRYEDLESGKEFVFYVYDDAALDAMAAEEKEALEDAGYVLKTSGEMEPFELKYDNKAVLSYDKATGTGDALGIIEDQDALGLDVEDISTAELESDAGDGLAIEESGQEPGSMPRAAVLAIVLACAAAFCIYLIKRD